MTAAEPIVVIGAGISGLAFARRCSQQGLQVVLLEKSRGTGGRCATRRVEGQPVDHGLPLLHGRGDAFGALLEELSRQSEALVLWGWPSRVRGRGTPCRPAGFDSRSVRAAIGGGVSTLARHLARGLDLRLETEVHRVDRREGGFELVSAGGETITARTLVVSCPVPQTVRLVQGLAEEGDELQALLWVLSKQVFALPCLTVIARYERPSTDEWHLVLPPAGSVIHTLINDSSKRPAGARQTLVLQATAEASRRWLEDDPAVWSEALLQAAAAELGPWAAAPAMVQHHRWRFARLQAGGELRRPALLRWADGAQLGLCGEAFDSAGGLEGAYLSGLALQRRLAADQATAVRGRATPSGQRPELGAGR